MIEVVEGAGGEAVSAARVGKLKPAASKAKSQQLSGKTKGFMREMISICDGGASLGPGRGFNLNHRRSSLGVRVACHRFG